MKGSLSSDYTKITLENDLIQQAFNSNTISNIEVTGQRNCCPDTVVNSVDFDKVIEPCIWKLVYYFDILNPGNNYETDISSFIFNVYGNDLNILPKPSPFNIFNISSLETYVEEWFTAEGYTDAKIVIRKTEYPSFEPTNQIYQIDITGLPSGVNPVTMDFVDEVSGCYIRMPYTCEPDGECDELQAQFSFNSALGDKYTVDKFILQDASDPEFGTEIDINDPSTNYVGPTFKYDPLNPIIPYSSITEIITQFNVESLAQGYGIVLDTITVNTTDHDMTFEFDDSNSNYRVLAIVIMKGSTPGDQDYNLINTYCTQEANPLPDCIYSATIDTDDSVGITSIFLDIENGIPYSILTTSYNYSDLDLIALNIEVETWLGNNGGNSQDFAVVITDGIATFSFSDMISGTIPLRIGGFDSEELFTWYNFNCTELANIPNPDQYDATMIEYTNDDIIVYPEFFGQIDVYSDGIYNLEVRVTLTNGDQIIEEVCIFSDKTIKCTVAEAMYLEPKRNYYQLYEAIVFAQDCDDCDCDQMCNLYKQLLTELLDAEPDSLCRCTTC